MYTRQMIFDVAPSQIQCLDAKQLVGLLRKLAYAEAGGAGINLRAVSVPMQITIADQGEDARVTWEGGSENTDYFPSRYSIFQAKAHRRVSPDRWKREVWTKATQKRGSRRKLNGAIRRVLEKNGAYVGFTGISLVGKYDKCIEAIKEGIADAGEDPSKALVIDIYDANKIAAWVSKFPPVSVWLSERLSGLPLRGFQTIDNWGKRADFAGIPVVVDKSQRFAVGAEPAIEQEEGGAPNTNLLPAAKAAERILDHLAADHTAVRIRGSSGVGKSRFVYEMLRHDDTIAERATKSSVIYCDFREVPNDIFAVARDLSDSPTPVLLVVDECPREQGALLNDVCATMGSNLRVLTIDFDDRGIEGAGVLNIHVFPEDQRRAQPQLGSDDLVVGIIRNRIPKASDQEVEYIRRLCGGFPRIAVLATEGYAGRAPILNSIGDVVDRILTGADVVRADQIRALECLSLFGNVGADDEFAAEFDHISERLIGLPGNLTYEYFTKGVQHHLISRRGRLYSVQPRPLSDYLGLRRLELMRVTSLVTLVEELREPTQLALLERWRYFDRSRTAREVSERLLSPGGLYGSSESVMSSHGSRCLNALVHIIPDAAADAIQRHFERPSLEQLRKATDGRRYLVWALEKLAFRRDTFVRAARVLLRLAAAENDQFGNNATGQFQQLFHLYLSGTEAPPPARLLVLDEGLDDTDERVTGVCVGALAMMLETTHFSRSGGAEEIGSQPPLRDWQPGTVGEAVDFHRAGLSRLMKVRRDRPSFRSQCEKVIADHLRSLLSEQLYDDLLNVVGTIVKENGVWLEAIEAVGDWLYFDRPSAPAAFGEKVRVLYDRLVPRDRVQTALLFVRFWSADIRDPDRTYKQDQEEEHHDFEYSTRKSIEIARQIAGNKRDVKRAVKLMAGKQLHNVFPFAMELGMAVRNRKELFELALDVYERSAEHESPAFIAGLLSGIDKKDGALAGRCVHRIAASESVNKHIIQIYASINVTPTRIREVMSAIREGNVSPRDSVILSYGGRLKNLEPLHLIPLLEVLEAKAADGGVSAALEIIWMYEHDSDILDPNIEGFLKRLMGSPIFLDTIGGSNQDGYHFQALVELMIKRGALGAEFARKLARQIVAGCRLKEYRRFLVLDDSLRAVAKLLVKHHPESIWGAVSRFYEMASRSERSRLDTLFGAEQHGFDGKEAMGEGVLFGLSESKLIEWAGVDPHDRIGFLCTFYPILRTESTGRLRWTAEVERLAGQFGQIEEFRDGLARRLYPTSWSGSLVPHLTARLEPLEEWFDHPVQELAVWAREIHRQLRRGADRQRSREDEESVG